MAGSARVWLTLLIGGRFTNVAASVLRVVADGGGGDDSIQVDATAPDVAGRAVLRLAIDGGSGDDWIAARIGAQGPIEMRAVTTVLGGLGNDTIELTIAADAWMLARTRTEVFGGGGYDRIDVSVTADGNMSGPAVTVIDGEGSNDSIRLETTQTSNFASNWISNHLLGGKGNDHVYALINTFGDNPDARFEQVLEGGGGDDWMIANIRFTEDYPSYVVSSRNLLIGGTGDDEMSAFAEALGEDASFAANVLRGGAGSDSLYAEAGVLLGGLEPEAYVARNRLFGGGGDNSLSGTIADDSPGIQPAVRRSRQRRGRRHRRRRNILDGGDGDDQLFGSAGTDAIAGGTGDDLIAARRGRRHPGGWRRSGRVQCPLWQDEGPIPSWTSMPQRCAPDLRSDGRGPSRAARRHRGDIERARRRGRRRRDRDTFDVGTILVFSGRGTGTVDSIGDLVDDPGSQIVDQLLV